MRELIRKLFRRCKHRYIEVGFRDEMIRPGYCERKHVWRCNKCGKYK